MPSWPGATPIRSSTIRRCCARWSRAASALAAGAVGGGDGQGDRAGDRRPAGPGACRCADRRGRRRRRTEPPASCRGPRRRPAPAADGRPRRGRRRADRRGAAARHRRGRRGERRRGRRDRRPSAARTARRWSPPTRARACCDEADPLALGGAGLSPQGRPHAAAADRRGRLRSCWSATTRSRCASAGAIPGPRTRRVIEIAPVPRTPRHARVPPHADRPVGPTLDRLGARLPPRPRWPDGAPARARAALAAAFAARPGWGPAAVFHTLRARDAARDASPPPTAARTASCSARSGAARRPRRLLQSSGLCTMACAVPLAAGQRLGRPGARPRGRRRRRARDGARRARHACATSACR